MLLKGSDLVAIYYLMVVKCEMFHVNLFSFVLVFTNVENSAIIEYYIIHRIPFSSETFGATLKVPKSIIYQSRTWRVTIYVKHS